MDKMFVDKVFVECESCAGYHRRTFHGDCRNDNERFPVPPDHAEVVISLEEQEAVEDKMRKYGEMLDAILSG